MLQAVVFDFDGVIVNSEPLHLRAFQEVLATEGHALSAQEYYGLYVGLDDAAMFRAFAAEHGLRASDGWAERLIAEKTSRMQAMLRHGSPLFAGAADRIREVAALVPVGIASGALRHEILQVLESEGLADTFSAIVAAGETERGKPAPDPYTRAVELVASAVGHRIEASSVVAVEDTLQGLAAARAAGLRTVAVTTTYARDLVPDADAIVPTLREVTISLLTSIVDDARPTGQHAGARR